MYCPRCRKDGEHVKMKVIKRKGGFHKKTKFKCKNCGFIRMKPNKKRIRKEHKFF